MKYPISEPVDIQIKFLLEVLALTDTDGKLEKMKTGASNLIFAFSCSSLKAIVHIYGNGEDNLDHENEKNNIKTIGFSKILAEFSNGFVLNYFEGEILTDDMVKDEKISILIAKKLAKFHSISSSSHNDVFKILDAFLLPLKSQPLNEKARDLQNLLKKELGTDNFVLTHGDMHARNIVLSPGGDNVEFIDYEASAYSWPLYDIAFFFLMMTGFQVDLRRFPSVEEQRHFLAAYYTSRDSTPPSKEQLDEGLSHVQLLVRQCELMIACWGFLQAKSPTTKGFPYQQYAEARLRCMDFDLPLPKEHPLAQGPLVSGVPV